MNSLTDWRSAFFLAVISNRLSGSPDTKLTPSWTCRNAGFSLFLAPGWTSGPPSADPAIWDMRTKEPICTVKWMFLFVHKSIYSYQCCTETFSPWNSNLNKQHEPKSLFSPLRFDEAFIWTCGSVRNTFRSSFTQVVSYRQEWQP